MSDPELFKYKLNKIANISCLCPTCHCLLHHGTWLEKEPLLNKLYLKHCNEIDSSYINIKSVEDIYIYYK